MILVNLPPFVSNANTNLGEIEFLGLGLTGFGPMLVFFTMQKKIFA